MDIRIKSGSFCVLTWIYYFIHESWIFNAPQAYLSPPIINLQINEKLNVIYNILGILRYVT